VATARLPLPSLLFLLLSIHAYSADLSYSTAESAPTLVHVSVTSLVEFIVVLAGAPKVITNKLQRVMNAAARVLSGREVRPRLDAVDV